MLENRVFTLMLSQDRGELVLGGHDPKAVKGPMVTTPVRASPMPDGTNVFMHYMIDVQSVKVGGHELLNFKDESIAIQAILDSGTSCLVVPDDTFEGGLLASPFKTFQKRFGELDEPTIEITIEGQTFTLPYDDYMVDDKPCVMKMKSTPRTFLLGDVFFRRMVVVHDLNDPAAPTISFGQRADDYPLTPTLKTIGARHHVPLGKKQVQKPQPETVHATADAGAGDDADEAATADAPVEGAKGRSGPPPVQEQQAQIQQQQAALPGQQQQPPPQWPQQQWQAPQVVQQPGQGGVNSAYAFTNTGGEGAPRGSYAQPMASQGSMQPQMQQQPPQMQMQQPQMQQPQIQQPQMQQPQMQQPQMQQPQMQGTMQPQMQPQQPVQGGAMFSYTAPAGGVLPQQPQQASQPPQGPAMVPAGPAAAPQAFRGGMGMEPASSAPMIQQPGEEAPTHTSGRRLLGSTAEVQRVPMTTSNSYIYYAQLGVGTPRQNDIHVILDTGSSVFAIFAVPHGGPTLLVICLLVCACILGATSIGLLALSWYQGEYEEEFPEHPGDHDPLLPGGERDLPSKA